MNRRKRPFRMSSMRGFTLLEVMVALILGTLVVGGVMGLLSTTLQYTHRLKEKSQIQPVLDAAAQEIFANPEKALGGSLSMAAFPNSPPVIVSAVAVVVEHDAEFGEQTNGRLYRVMLSCKGQVLEFSVIVPESVFE